MKSPSPSPTWPKAEWLSHTEASEALKHDVLRSAAEGDPSAIEYAWHLFGGLVIRWARRRGMDPREATGDLYVGFHKAVRDYEPSKGRFSTYLHLWLLNAADARMRGSNQFGALKSRANMRVLRELLRLGLPLADVDASGVEAVARQLGMPDKTVANVLRHVTSTATIEIEREGSVFPRPLRSTQCPPDESAHRARVWEHLGELPEREQMVMVERFVEERSLRDVGETLGLTPERVRVIEAKALRRLRHLMRHEFLEMEDKRYG